jgi:type II secretory pathway pseudopilin PulG
MTTMPQPPSLSATPKTSGLAIASLICSIAGICGGITAVVGLILGIVALVKIRGSQGQLRGSGLAVAGIVVSLLIILSVLGLLVFGIQSSMQMARNMSAQANARQINLAAIGYATENNDNLPPGDSWDQVLVSKGYLEQGKVFQYPPDTGRGFAMNSKLAGMNISQIGYRSRTVLFFECVPGSPPSGGPELLPAKPRNSGKYVIAFVDGSVQPVLPEEVGQLRWEP